MCYFRNATLLCHIFQGLSTIMNTKLVTLNTISYKVLNTIQGVMLQFAQKKITLTSRLSLW